MMPRWCLSYTYSSIYKYDDDMLILGLTMIVHSWSWKPRTFCDEVLAQHLKRWQCFLEVSWQSSIWSLDSPRLKYRQWLTKYEVCASFMMTIQVCVNAWLWWTWQVWFAYLGSDIPDCDWVSMTVWLWHLQQKKCQVTSDIMFTQWHEWVVIESDGWYDRDMCTEKGI